MCSRIADLRSAGASRVVALVKEDIANEVQDFRNNYWSEEVFLDSQRRFFMALGGGKENKPQGAAGFIAMMLNPFSKHRTKTAVNKASEEGVKGNMVGEGFVTGGVYVVRQDGKAAYCFLEEQIGDHAPIEDIIEGIKAAVKREVSCVAPSSLQDENSSSHRMTWKEWAGRTTGPDGYQIGDITRGLAGYARRKNRS